MTANKINKWCDKELGDFVENFYKVPIILSWVEITRSKTREVKNEDKTWSRVDSGRNYCNFFGHWMFSILHVNYQITSEIRLSTTVIYW